MTAGQLFNAGKLTEACAAAFAAVRARPTDTAARGLLAEMLCFTGEWERADKQLETLLQQAPDLAVGVAQFRQLIRAEIARQQFYVEGRLPEFLGEPSPVLRLHLKASVCLRDGDQAAAKDLLAEAERLRTRRGGTCNGRSFADFRDTDELTASFCEVLTSNGKYYWVPIERIESIEFRPPARPRDLLWRQATLTVIDGPEGQVSFPTLYYADAAQGDDAQGDAIRLGHVTEWTGGDQAPLRGLGQRTFLLDADECGILEIQQITFAS